MDIGRESIGPDVDQTTLLKNHAGPAFFSCRAVNINTEAATDTHAIPRQRRMFRPVSRVYVLAKTQAPDRGAYQLGNAHLITPNRRDFTGP